MASESKIRHNIGTTHREVLVWVRKATAGDELRAAKGLYLRKTEGGAYWVYRYRSPVTGKQVRAQLWADDERGMLGFPDASLEEATTRAATLRAKVSNAIDPVLAAAQARAESEAAAARELEQQQEIQRQLDAAAQATERASVDRMTVRKLAVTWQRTALMQRRLSNGNTIGRKDSGLQTLAQFRLHVYDLIGDQPIEKVRKSDILRVVDRLMATGKQRAASMVLGDLKQMYSWAAERDLVELNPTASIKRSRHVGHEVARERTLSIEELKLLGQAIASARMSPRSGAAIWLILATGVRVGELLGAVWDDALPPDPKARTARLHQLQVIAEEREVKLGIVDVQARSWHLTTSKNGRSHDIHLSDFALAELGKLSDLREVLIDAPYGSPSPWLFPANKNDRPVIVTSFGKQLADRQGGTGKGNRSTATNSLELPGGKWTAHDLRRTAASLMASLGVSGDVIDEALNHLIASKVRRTYIRNRREADQVRAFDALGQLLTQLQADPAPA
ncbi:MAG: hypothetical protein RL722_1715 [Pseudomonadota bacterium]|jgi:integrase